MKATIIAVALLLTTSGANASSINFNITFLGLPNGGPILGAGSYTITNGQISAFHAVITACANAQVVCNFNAAGGADPFDNIPSETDFLNVFSPPINGTNEALLHLFESGPNVFTGLFSHEFTTHTPGAIDPSGFYVAVATPEPTALWLLLAGSLVFAWMRRRWFSDLPK